MPASFRDDIPAGQSEREYFDQLIESARVEIEYWRRFYSSQGVGEPQADAAVDPTVATERQEGTTRDE